MGRETCNNNSRALHRKGLYELQYSTPSVDCTRELSTSYNGNQRDPTTYSEHHTGCDRSVGLLDPHRANCPRR